MTFRSRHVSFPSNYFSPDLHIFGRPVHFHFMFKETPLTLSPRIPTAPVALERMLNTVAANAPKIVLIDVEDDA